MQYSYNNNILTGTTLSSTKEGGTNKTISSSTAYTSDNNRVESVTDAAGNTVTYTYDSMGRVSTVTSGNSKTTYTYYSGTDRVQTVTSDTSSNSSAAVTYTYDTAGRLTNITRGTTVYTILYDEWGNQKAVKIGNTALSTNTYEQGNGNLTNTTYGNGTSVDFIYDKLDRLTSKKINGISQFTQVFNNTGAIARYQDHVTGVDWKYSYDLIGRLTDITGTNGNLYRYIYDSENRIGEMRYTIGGATRSTNYTYNVLGIPNTTTFNGAVKSRVLDDLGRITSQKITTPSNTDILTSYTYKDINSTKTTNTISAVTNPFGTYNYTYDSLGNVIGISGAEKKTYIYDYLGQLVGELGGGVNYTVIYDAFGNITNKNGKQYLYDTQNGWGDLLVSYDGQTITYDAIGNPTTYRNMAMSWQNGRQLATLTKDGTTYSYAYDSSGIRYQKIVGDKTYTFTYIDGNLVHQTDGTNIWWFYYDSDGTIMAMEYNGTTYYYVTDGIGNIVGLVDTNGATVASYTYDAWGKILTATGSMADINPIRYKSYYFDSETGFYYLMSRYYDPEVGRFINADAYASTGQGVLGYNMFAYCGNNPVTHADYSGNSCLPITNNYQGIFRESGSAVRVSTSGAAGYGGASGILAITVVYTSIASIPLILLLDAIIPDQTTTVDDSKAEEIVVFRSDVLSKSASRTKARIRNDKRMHDYCYWVALYVDYGNGEDTYIPTIPLSYSEAISYVRSGGSVFADSRNNAYKLAKAVGGGMPDRDPAHGGMGFWRHYHATRGGVRIGGHVFYVT